MRTKYPLPNIINPGTSRYVCVPVPDDPGHRQAFLGAILNLASWFEWQPDPLKRGKDAAAVWLPIFNDIVDQLAESKDSCSEDPPGNACCVDYPPNADFVAWAPIDPYTDPATVPPGYQFPPWYVVNNIIPFTGLQPGDVMTDLLHGPIVEPFSSGFPRFRINVSGPGTVEVEFIRFPTAGVALISIDAQLGSVRWVDLHTSLAASIGSVEAKMIIPIEVSGAGAHYIDITMIYSITEAPPFVHFGGGIRKISLCGFGDQPTPVINEGWEDEVSICTQLRYFNGKLQGLCCFNAETGLMEWVDIQGQGDGIINDTAVTPNGTSRPAALATTCYNVQLAANSRYQFPWPVQNGDTISVSNLTGAWNDGTTTWYCTDGTPYVLNLCIGAAGHAMGDPDSVGWHMQLIAYDGTTYYPIVEDVPFTIAGLGDPHMLTIFANDDPLSDNAGTISFKVCGQNGATPPVGEWCRDYNFAYGSKLGFVEGAQCEWTGSSFRKIIGLCDGEAIMDAAAFVGIVITSVDVYMSVFDVTQLLRFEWTESGTQQVDGLQGAFVTLTMPSGGASITSNDARVIWDHCGSSAETVTRIVLHGTGTPPTNGLAC